MVLESGWEVPGLLGNLHLTFLLVHSPQSFGLATFIHVFTHVNSH